MRDSSADHKVAFNKEPSCRCESFMISYDGAQAFESVELRRSASSHRKTDVMSTKGP